MKKLFCLFLSLISTASFATINLNAQPSSGACMVGHDCYLSSIHDIEIKNETANDQQFEYSYSLCSDNNRCNEISNKVIVKGNSTWNNHYNGHLQTVFNWNGTHQVWAKTIVNGMVVMNSNSVSVI